MFIAFWTAIPLWLAQVPFSLSQGGIARVALAGVAGAVAPPFANRLVDVGRARVGTAMVLTLFARSGTVATVVVAAVLLDAAVSANLVFGQRAIYALAPEHGSRVNALFIAAFFAARAAASAASGWAFAHFGWRGRVVLGAGLRALALPYCLTEG